MTIHQAFFMSEFALPGQVEFTSATSTTWQVPTGVYTISALCVGGGGGGAGNNGTFDHGGGGGGLSYAVSIAVTPGETLTIDVGAGGNGGATAAGQAGGTSSIKRGATTLLHATGGGGGVGSASAVTPVAGGSGGTTLGYSGGGNGGGGGTGSANSRGGGGGGAGGYSGDGGVGGTISNSPGNGSGGGGAGGQGNATQGNGGGGVGIYGEGSSGLAVAGEGINGGGGGSGGSNGVSSGNVSPANGGVVQGGLYGGGGSGGDSIGSAGANGAVRIIWGSDRAYPSTNTGDYNFTVSESTISSPSLVGSSSNNLNDGTNYTSISLTKPVGTQPGDLAIAMLTGGGGANNVDNWTNTSFTFLYENVTAGTVNSAIAYRVLDGTEGASFTFTTTNACKLSGELVVYRGGSIGGITTSSLGIISGSQNLQAANNPLVANSITVASNSILYAMFSQQNDNAVFSSVPSDLTLLRTYSFSHKHNYWIGHKSPSTDSAAGNYQITSSLSDSSANFLFNVANVPSFVDAAAITQTGSTGATITLDKPAGTQEGDLMIAFYTTDATSGFWTPDTGWTEIVDSPVSSLIVTGASYKIATSSEPSSYTFTCSDNTGTISGVILTYRNAQFDVVGTISAGAVSNVQTAPSITTGASGSRLLAFFAEANGNRTWSSPTSGLIERSSDLTSNGRPSWIVYEDTSNFYNIEATGNKSATCSSGGTACYLLSINPK